jgi:hypothetical protein
MHVRTAVLGGAVFAAGLAVVAGGPGASAAPTTVNFSATGSVQTWTVPSGVTSVDVVLCGADGLRTTAVGGIGAEVTATLAVTPGETLDVVVGGMASGTTGGFNGGGDGAGLGGGGGGATDIRQGGSTLADRVLVAGGGGGAGSSTAGLNPGGDGGTVGANGQSGPKAGLGGGSSAGGAGGLGLPSSGGGGALGVGGAGGSMGGGGGGGLYGGGGGGGNPAASTDGGGGGGGSSLAGATGTVRDGACGGPGTAVLTYDATQTTTSSTSTTTTSSSSSSSSTTIDPIGPGGTGTAPGARPLPGTSSFTG